MNYPLPGLTIKINAEQKFNYLNFYENKIESSSIIKEVSNYEYEINENEKKRKIAILKKEYLPTIIGDLRNIMKYSKSSQYISEKNKKGFNPNISN